MEEANAGKKDEYLDLAFSAGMLFDIFALIASAQEHKKKLTPYVEEVYKQGYKTALIAAEICKTIPIFGYKRYFFAACNGSRHRKNRDGDRGARIPRFSRGMLQERSPAPVTPLRRAEALRRQSFRPGRRDLRLFQSFRAVFDRAILYQHEPFLLALREKKLFELSRARFALDEHRLEFQKRSTSSTIRCIKRWKGPELGPYKIDMAKVMQSRRESALGDLRFLAEIGSRRILR